MNYDDFEKEIYGETVYNQLTYDDLEQVALKSVNKSIFLMFLGLVVTGITGFLFLRYMLPMMTFKSFNLIWKIAVGLEFVVVIAFSTMAYKAEVNLLKVMLLIYSILNGITLSVIGLVYHLDSIIFAFLGTVVLFAVLSVYGFVTKENLSKLSSILFSGLIALIVMGILNIFLKSDTLMWVSSFLGVGIFMVFVAYDINRIKNNVIDYAINEDSTILERIEIVGALELYLDFINLFIYILRILGRRKS